MRSGGTARKDDLNTAAVREMTELYKRLNTSYSEYVKALKEGNTQNQSYWKGQLNSAKETMRFVKSNAESLIDEAGARKKVLEIISDSETVMNRYYKTIRDTHLAEEERARAAKQAAEQQAKANAEAVAAERERATAAAAAAEQRNKTAADAKIVKDVADAYEELTTAQSNYLAAVKNKNENSQGQALQEIQNARALLDVYAQKLDSYNLEDAALKKVKQTLYDSIAAEDQYKASLSDLLETQKKANAAQLDAQKKADAAAQKKKDDKAEADATKEAVKAVTDEYNRLAEARRQYLSSFKAGDMDGAQYWQGEIDKTKELIPQLEQVARQHELTATQQQKLSNLANDEAANESKLAVQIEKAAAAQNKQNKETGNGADQMQRMVAQAERWIATMVVMRGLKSMWNGMVEYAKDYYDAMNEIRIVTMMSEEEAEKLGSSYRQLAAEMSVSSKEIAEAAVEYWRQGLGPDEVAERLKYTTMYAKISALDFQEAAELMTAATNAMGISADHVADVWAYLGDASASGADEIGIAMQKVSAVADQAGISFEWLGSYIATLSEKTRLAPEAIGTAMNSILSRLQQIKQKGFNDEDVYKINDIAKALGSLEKPIALMDEATGEWRNFPDIMNDIADQWGNLTDKEQAYIATTMGGTRQRNFLLTLLNDLSQASVDGSRAWELYTGAQEAAGVAMEKYSIYEESVAAAQGRLKASTEELYASIMNGDMIKSWYDGLTGVVNIINAATDATGGWNIKLTALAAGIVLITGALKAAGGAGSIFATILSSVGIGATTAAGGVSMLNVALAATIAGAVILGITTIAGALLSLATNAEKAAKNAKELSDALSVRREAIGGIDDSVRGLEKLSASLTGTNEDVKTFNAAREDIIAKYPALKEVLSQEVTQVDQVAAAYQKVIDTLQKYNDAEVRRNWADAHSGIKDASRTYASGVDAYNRGMTFTEQTRLDAAKSMMDRNGGFLKAYPYNFNDLKNLGSIEAYKSYIALFEENIANMESYILNSGEKIDEAMYDQLDGWRNILYNVLMPGLDSMTNDANEKITENISTILTDAVNAYENGDIINAIPSILDKLLGRDWINNGNVMDEAQVREAAEYAVQAYRDAVDFAREQIATLNYEDLDEKGIASIQESLLGLLREGAVPEDEIVEILTPFYEGIGRTRDQLLADLVAGNEASGVDAGGDNETFDEKLERAYQYLEQLETLRESIREIAAEGTLSKDIIEGLRSAFEDDDGSWVQSLIDAATENGEFNLDAFVEKLREQLAAMESDEDANALLKALGLDLDVTDSAVSKALDKIAKADTVKELIDIWAALPEAVQRAIGASFPEIEKMISETEAAATQAGDNVEKALGKIQRSLDLYNLQQAGKVWEDLDSVMNDIADGGSKASKALSEVQGRIDDTAEAMGALEAAKNGTAAALEYLATMTGLTADSLRNDLTPAEYAVAEAALQTEASVEYLANMLYTAGAIQIDPSGNVSALGSIEEAAAAAGMTVAQFSMALASLNGAYFQLQMNAAGTAGRVVAKVNPVKWGTGTSFKSSSSKKSSGGGSGKKSGGGGGGGGSGSKAVSDIVNDLVDAFDKVNELRDHRRELAQLGQSYHEARGEIQGVIAYLEIERDVLVEDTTALESYLAQLETQIEANRAIVTTEAEGSKAYNQAMIDLDKLQEEHQKYSKTLIQNQTDVENLTKAIKEQNDKIRQMEIDLENTILEAIEDREAAVERQLSGRIAMEEEIMALLKKRYEAERDQIIETQNIRKDALNEELEQIDELLAARKKLADQEDKMAEIAELEQQIARISADPTRQKEALQLQQKLAKLREDMAWDAAEEEANAQKDSIKKQITNIDDYIAYVNDYYEELFKNPVKLIEEMQEILTWTDDQIISWLKKNSEDYATSTDAVRKQMVNNWQSTLDDMRDTIRTHWVEVQQIIEGGADNILNFLTTYSQKYREASAKQAEAYVDEWKKQLSDLEAAHRQVQATISSYNYVQTKNVDSGSSGGGGGGGGGTATSIASSGAKIPYETFQWGYKNKAGSWVKAPEQLSAIIAFSVAKKAAQKEWADNPGILAILDKATIASPGRMLKQYAEGGMNTMTGLAWLDGTKSKPERILSSYQTELFEDMINSLHQIRMHTGTFSQAPKYSSASALPNIESIVINVASLDSDADYKDGAEKLMNAFYEKIARGRPVGGIQGW